MCELCDNKHKCDKVAFYEHKIHKMEKENEHLKHLICKLEKLDLRALSKIKYERECGKRGKLHFGSLEKPVDLCYYGDMMKCVPAPPTCPQ